MLKATYLRADIRRMGERRLENVDGYENQWARTILLAVGWSLLAAGLLALIAGWFFSWPALSVVGVGASLAAWAASGVLPDPQPAARRDIRERNELIAKLEGHQLPA
jgi:hypothetical protein